MGGGPLLGAAAAGAGGPGGNLLVENSGHPHPHTATPSPCPDWAPNVDHINEIVSLFSKAGSLDNAVQQQLAQAFQQLNQMPDSPSYLTCILSNPEFPPDVRQLAGLTLKSTLQQQRALGLVSPSNVTNYIRPLLLEAITDPDRGVRQAAGSAITMLLSIEGIASWPAALQRLFQLLDDPRDDVLDGAFSALSKVVEDALSMLVLFPSRVVGGSRRGGGGGGASMGGAGGLGMGEDDPNSGQNLGVDEEVFAQFCVSFLLPKLFALALPGNKPVVRSYAVNCLSHFVQRNRAFGPNEVFESFFPQYWNLLGQLAQESDPEMRRFVVQGMVQVRHERVSSASPLPLVELWLHASRCIRLFFFHPGRSRRVVCSHSHAACLAACSVDAWCVFMLSFCLGLAHRQFLFETQTLGAMQYKCRWACRLCTSRV